MIKRHFTSVFLADPSDVAQSLGRMVAGRTSGRSWCSPLFVSGGKTQKTNKERPSYQHASGRCWGNHKFREIATISQKKIRFQ